MSSVRTLITAVAATLLALFSTTSAIAQPAVSAQPATTAGAPTAPTAAAVSLNNGYKVGVGDVLEVSVLGRDEYRARVQVQTDGTILLPYINSIPATNKTILELRDTVQKALEAGGYYTKPAVSVVVTTFASRYVVVLGEVGTPGIVPIDRAYRVSEIIARAGGLRTAGADAVTLTPEGGEPRQLSLREAATGGADKDPFVNPGDKIYIAPPKTFYIYGQVNAPGTYPIDRSMNVRKALARGGGLTALGSEGRVKVIRDGKELKKFSADAPIEDGDVIVVGERFF